MTTDRSADVRAHEITLTTVANPRRIRVDADGRPEPVPAARPSEQD